ncbi:MAG: DNA adenine methylase [Campylobacterales bacterium]
MSVAHSPLRYPGGKGRIFPFVSSLLVENGIVGCRYVEPYAGGAGLALRLLYEEYAESIVINDLDPMVYSFWMTCKLQTNRLIDWIDKTPVNIDTWKLSKEIIKNKNNSNIFDLATAFFFLNRTNVSGVINGGVIGGIQQTGQYKIDARYNRHELIKKIEKIGKFSSRIDVTNKDGIRLMSEYSLKNRNSFIYLDPPYFEKGSNLYLNFYKMEDHIRLSENIASLSAPWLLSYDYEGAIIDMYRKYRKMSYKLQHSTSNKIGDEILVFSNGLEFEKSITNLNCVATI